MRALVVTALVCLAFLGSVSAGGKAGSPHVVPPPKKTGPTAWEYISSQPDLTAVAGLLKSIGYDKVLSQDFTGTLVLPVNAAVAAYTAQFKGNVTAFPDVFNSFLGKLLAYHFILRSAPAWQLETIALSTKYTSSWTAFPHKVTFVTDNSTSKPSPKGWRWSHKGWAGKPLPPLHPVVYIIDEQGNNVSFVTKDAFVQGGGVIHTINQVLNANDIFPSISAAASNPDLSTLLSVVTDVSAALNITLLDLLENTPGTLAAPTNAAFAAVNLTGLTPEQLLQVLAYHFAPAPGGNVKGLLFYKFTSNKKFNPALTYLGAVIAPNPALKLLFNQTYTGFLTPEKLHITYPTGSSGTIIGKSNIVVPDIATPLAVTHVVDTVLVPPGL